MESTRRLRKLLVFGLMSANLAVFAVTAYSVVQTKQQFEDRAEHLSQNVALAAAQNITTSFEKIDLILSDVKWEIENGFDGEHSTIANDIPGRLSRIQQRLPEVEAIRVVDAQGMIVGGSDLQSSEFFSVADREYFTYHRSDNNNRIHLSEPAVDRVISQPLITLGRRLNDPKGEFAGVIYAIMTVDYLSQLLAGFNLGEHGTLTLRDSDLRLITRWPPIRDNPAGEIGSRLVSPELREQIKKGVDVGTIPNAHAVDGTLRTVSFRRLARFPFFVVAGVAQQDYLAALWGQRLLLDLIIAVGLTLMSLVIAHLSLRLIRQSEQSRLAGNELLNRLLKIAGQVPGVVYQFKLSPDGRICFPFSSGAMRDIFQMSPERLQEDATAASELIHPDDIASVRLAMAQSARDLTPWEQEFRIRFADGTIHWLRANSVPQREADGSVLWHGFMSDITRRKDEERAVESRARNLAALLETASDGIHIVDESGALCEFSHSFAAMLGYTDDEIRNFKAWDWDAQMSEGQILALIQRVISTPTTFTTQHRKKNGSVIDVEINAKGVEIDGKLYLYASSRDITERKLLEDKIKSMAFFDALTNLPNRRLLGDRLNQALATATRSMKYGALMFIDLDNFKPLNDSAGHDAGDLLLIEVGRRLTDCMRQTDTVARVGGDEFVALASEIDGDRSTAEMQAERIAEKIRVAIAAPYVLTIQHAGQPPRSIEHNCTASIGVVLFPQAMGDTEDYLKWADAAMYEAKESGRNRVCVYQP